MEQHAAPLVNVFVPDLHEILTIGRTVIRLVPQRFPSLEDAPCLHFDQISRAIPGSAALIRDHYAHNGEP
ncbi:hypothetical protein [Microbacterium sp. BWT-B31]|uniref:hypothetical protein n=1 Tax=Microbacterium sp. BWT-B31 TaxID=3232072 RepID=UPI00352926AB